jgi:dynein heavy chain
VKIPWEDLSYIFGAIMSGGHIVDDWDRKMCATYLNYFMVDELLDETEMVPYSEGKLSWPSPPPGPHEKYIEHIETMPPESPLLFGMHPNAEIGFRTTQCFQLFGLLMMLQPKENDGDDSAEASPMAKAEQLCNDFLDEVRDINFPVEDLIRSMSDEEKGPYQFVFLQECEYMNVLVFEMVRSLAELQLGFKGELTMSPAMEGLANCLYLETISPKWQKYGFPSTRALMSWLPNLKERCEQLNDWVAEPLTIPKVVDISKFFNPQSFLNAIKQLTCQQQQLELDKLQVFTEVTKRDAKGVDAAARDGAFVSGMFLEGARWDLNANCLEESKPKEMFFKMPVINCRAGPAADREEKNIYICPTYCVPTRRPYFVFAAQLRTKLPPAKWVLGGVALILDVGIAL